MDDHVKQKIRILSFVAMIAVVIIHSNTIGTLPNPSAWNVWFQQAFSRLGTSWAVPFFFVISGFLYQRLSVSKGYRVLLLAKARSLLLPYVLWALVGTVLSVALVVVNNAITGHELIERTFLARPGLWEKVNALLGITLNGPMGNLALWYVRSLMLLFILSPLWQLLAKLPAWVLGGIALGGVLLCGESGFPLLELRYSSVGFFLLGVASAIGHWETAHFSPRMTGFVGLLWLALVVIVASGQTGCFTDTVKTILSGVMQVGGIGILWSVYDVWSEECPKKPLPRFMERSFWVYCLHGPLGGWFVAASLFLIGKDDVSSVCIAVFAPMLTILVCLWLAWFCNRVMPRMYSVLTGARG